MLGFMGSGSPELEASLTLGHCIIHFLCTLVVPIGTMKYFYCPQKDVSLVPWDSLYSADQTFLRDKYPDAGEGAVCEFCVRSARPSAFFSRRSSGSSSSGPQSVDSGLLAPAVDSLVVPGECEVAESSTSYTPPPPLYKLRPCPSYSRRRDRINLVPNFNSVPNVVQPHKTWVWV